MRGLRFTLVTICRAWSTAYPTSTGSRHSPEVFYIRPASPAPWACHLVATFDLIAHWSALRHVSMLAVWPMSCHCGAGYGLLVCMLSMLAGAAVEWYRLRLFQQGAVLTASANRGTQPAIVDMSVFFQIPQYILVGLSEVTCTPQRPHLSPRRRACSKPGCNSACALFPSDISPCQGHLASGTFISA